MACMSKTEIEELEAMLNSDEDLKIELLDEGKDTDVVVWSPGVGPVIEPKGTGILTLKWTNTDGETHEL